MAYFPLIPAAIILLVGICIYINPGPKVVQDERTAWLKDIPIAHRGRHTNDSRVPENSLKAFREAMDKGYAIELDVVRSADNKVVVFHDKNLKRMTGLDQDVTDLPWEQFKDLRLLGSAEGIPLLADVLELVQGKVPLLIEIKNDGSPVGLVEAALIENLKGYVGDFAIQAFNPFVLRYIREHAPDFVRGQLSASFKGENLALYKKFLLKNLLMNNQSRPAFVAYEVNALPRWFAKRLRAKGLYLLTWTVTNLEDYHKAVETYDNIIFEGFELPSD